MNANASFELKDTSAGMIPMHDHIEARREARPSNAEFLANLSHDLRTPLNVMVGYNDMLIDGALGPLGDEQVETLQKIRDYSVQLLATLGRLAEAVDAQVHGAEAGRREGSH